MTEQYVGHQKQTWGAAADDKHVLLKFIIVRFITLWRRSWKYDSRCILR